MSDDVLLGILKSLERIEQNVQALRAEVGALATRAGHVEAEANVLRAFVAERHAEVIGNIRRNEAKGDRVEQNLDRVRNDVSDVNHRLVEVDVQIASWAGNFAVQTGRHIRFESRLDLLEKRLDLRDAPSPPK